MSSNHHWEHRLSWWVKLFTDEKIPCIMPGENDEQRSGHRRELSLPALQLLVKSSFNTHGPRCNREAEQFEAFLLEKNACWKRSRAVSFCQWNDCCSFRSATLSFDSVSHAHSEEMSLVSQIGYFFLSRLPRSRTSFLRSDWNRVKLLASDGWNIFIFAPFSAAALCQWCRCNSLAFPGGHPEMSISSHRSTNGDRQCMFCLIHFRSDAQFDRFGRDLADEQFGLFSISPADACVPLTWHCHEWSAEKNVQFFSSKRLHQCLDASPSHGPASVWLINFNDKQENHFFWMMLSDDWSLAEDREWVFPMTYTRSTGAGLAKIKVNGANVLAKRWASKRINEEKVVRAGQCDLSTPLNRFNDEK